jgi:hypothetical protein
MKSEQDIKQRIKDLRSEGSLTSFICMIMLLWVLDIDVITINNYTDKLQGALKVVDEFADTL